jgi:GT2 family glycosyltransferase
MPPNENRVDYSVAIPAYGRPELIKQTVRAALAQRFSPDMTWEVVVNDDHTPIPLAGALSEFGNRIRIERNNKNLGWPENWNQTLRIARGRWVHMLHSDDLVDPDFVQVMWQILKDHPEAAFIHSLTRKIVDGRPIIARLYTWFKGNREPQDNPSASVQVFASGPESVRHALEGVRVTTVVVRRDAACSIDGMRPEFGGPSDEEYLVRLARLGDVVFCPRRLITYRYHSSQDSSQTWLRRTFVDEYSVVHEHSLKVLGSYICEDDRRIVDQRVANVAGRVAMTQALAGDLESARYSIERGKKRFPEIVQDPEFRKAKLIVYNKSVRRLYRWFFIE